MVDSHGFKVVITLDNQYSVVCDCDCDRVRNLFDIYSSKKALREYELKLN